MTAGSDDGAPIAVASDNLASRKGSESTGAFDPCPSCRALIEASGRSLAEILLPTDHLQPEPSCDRIAFAARSEVEQARDRARRRDERGSAPTPNRFDLPGSYSAVRRGSWSWVIYLRDEPLCLPCGDVVVIDGEGQEVRAFLAAMSGGVRS